MRPSELETAEKLRGGYYTPGLLVAHCLERLLPLLADSDDLRILEPSVGDGAFLRGISDHSEMRNRVSWLTAVEPDPGENRKSREELRRLSLSGEIVASSVIPWAARKPGRFDAAVGNPPFVRYQYMSGDDRDSIGALGQQAGFEFSGVGNLWMPVLVAALTSLKPQGAFSFVVPSELMTGSSAARFRAWISRECADLRVDLFPPNSFPDVLQEIVVLSGRRATIERGATSYLTISEGGDLLSRKGHTHEIGRGEPNWTRFLLSPGELAAFEAAQGAPGVRELGRVARFQVSVVTGANDFFTVTDQQLAEHELTPWAVPLLSRARHAPGLVMKKADHTRARLAGEKAWLLDFSGAHPDPNLSASSGRYMESGESAGLPRRYKCRIREPWYRVPHIRLGSLLLSKRSHVAPRVLHNQFGAYTTDTIYRGIPHPETGLAPEQIVAAFHTSLTMLSAEIEGRSFGGGVLELVPSEIARLAIIDPGTAVDWIDQLDGIQRTSGHEALVKAADKRLVHAGVLDVDHLAVLKGAYESLLTRRLARNRAKAGPRNTRHKAA